LRAARIIEEAGWPAGGLNVLSLSNDDAGLIISDDRIKLLRLYRQHRDRLATEKERRQKNAWCSSSVVMPA